MSTQMVFCPQLFGFLFEGVRRRLPPDVRNKKSYIIAEPPVINYIVDEG